MTANDRKRLLRSASVIMLVLGTGHLLLATFFARDHVTGWVGEGLWAVWCLVGGVLLVPSPYFAGIIAGALIVVAARNPLDGRGSTDSCRWHRRERTLMAREGTGAARSTHRRWSR